MFTPSTGKNLNLFHQSAAQVRARRLAKIHSPICELTKKLDSSQIAGVNRPSRNLTESDTMVSEAFARHTGQKPARENDIAGRAQPTFLEGIGNGG